MEALTWHPIVQKRSLQLTVRVATSQLELTELEEGSEQDIQAIAAQYEEEDEEVVVHAGAATA